MSLQHTFTEPAPDSPALLTGIAAFDERTHASTSSAISYLNDVTGTRSRKISGSRSQSNTSNSNGKDLGVEHLSFSPSGRFLIATSASPTSNKTLLLLVRFVRSSPALPYTSIRPRLCTIIKLRSPVKRLAWRPSNTLDGKESLAIATGQKNILLWNEEIPNEGQVSSEEEMDEQEYDSSKTPSPGLMEVISIPSSTHSLP